MILPTKGFVTGPVPWWWQFSNNNSFKCQKCSCSSVCFCRITDFNLFYLQMWWRLCNLTHCFICSAQSHLQFIGCCFFVDLNNLFLLIQIMATLSWPPAWPCWRLLRSRRFLKEMMKSTKRFLSALSLPPTSGTPITYKIYKTGQHPLLCVIIILIIYLLEMRDLFSFT